MLSRYSDRRADTMLAEAAADLRHVASRLISVRQLASREIVYVAD
jgi:hypothetical protein